MSLKQFLYDKKQAVKAHRTPKMHFAEGEKLAIVQGLDVGKLQTILADYKVINDINVVSDDDYGRIEIFFGSPRKESLKRMTSLKWLQLSSAGLNGYDDRSLYSGDVLLTTARGVYGLPISECVIGDIIFLMKSALSNAVGKKYSVPALSSTDFAGATVIICGAGDIGRNVALRCKGMQSGRIIGFDKFVTYAEHFDELYAPDRLEEFIALADVVVSALPATDETDGIFNKKTFSLMKRGALFINVGRGNSVDQKALLDSINNGHLGGAALDATTPDPLPQSHPLRKSGRVLITDHLSCISTGNSQRLIDHYCSQAELYVNGELK